MVGMSVVAQVQKWARSKRIRSTIEYVFEDGDFGKGRLMECCKQHDDVEPIFRSKKKAVVCQAADIIAWKSRVTILGIQDLDRADDAGMDRILNSLGQIAVRPTTSIVYTKKRLMDACLELDIPRR